MKKKTILYMALLLIPLAVVGIAVSPASVTVVRNGETFYTSFATAVEGSTVGWCAPVTLILTYALFGMGVFYSLQKKAYWLKAVRATAFAAAFLAAFPIVAHGEVLIVPNVLAAVLLIVLWVMANMGLKNKDSFAEEKPKGKRLAGK